MDSLARREWSSALYQGASVVADFIERSVVPLLPGMNIGNTATTRDLRLQGLYMRAVCLMRSLKRLNKPTDFQVVLGIARTLLEIEVDMALVSTDKSQAMANKLDAWERSAKLHSCKSTVEYFKRKGIPVPEPYKVREDFVKTESPAIVQERQRYWGSKHPGRWTGQDLASDARKSENALPWTKLEESYETQYRVLCFFTHSGLVGVSNVPSELFACYCGMAFETCANLALICTRLLLDEQGYSSHIDLYRLLDEITERRQAALREAILTSMAREHGGS